MTIIKPNSKPRLWWLFPWSYARTLHTSANALRALSDRLDDALTLQSHVIADQSEEIANLRSEVEHLHAVIKSHKDAGLRLLAMLDEERRKNGGQS